MIKKRHRIIPTSYLVLLKDNKILLLRRFNTGYEDGSYSLIAGHVEPGETFVQCIIREAKEEAGIMITPEDLESIHFLHRNAEPNEITERIDVFFKLEKWEGEIVNKEPNKCDDLSWFDKDNLPRNTIHYILKVLEKIRNKEIYREYGWN